jgi:hypothetical protein
MSKLKLSFSKNWNRKLYCDYFTTIRKVSDKNENFYTEGQEYEVYNGDFKTGITCVCTKVERTRLVYVSDALLSVDTGMDAEDSRKMFEKMYKDTTGGEFEVFVVTFKRTGYNKPQNANNSDNITVEL